MLGMVNNLGGDGDSFAVVQRSGSFPLLQDQELLQDQSFSFCRISELLLSQKLLFKPELLFQPEHLLNCLFDSNHCLAVVRWWVSIKMLISNNIIGKMDL